MPRARQLTLNFDVLEAASLAAPEVATEQPEGEQALAGLASIADRTRNAVWFPLGRGGDRELPLLAPSIDPGVQPLADQGPLTPTSPSSPAGEKARAHAILEAVRILHRLHAEQRPATPEERASLARFAGFGAVARSLFPNPLTGTYKDASWQELGEELTRLLSSPEYDSAKRSTFNAFYTSPTVMGSMHRSLARLGVPADAVILEPGCGSGNFIGCAPSGQRFIGVELDRTSGGIAQALHPTHDIRIEDFRITRLSDNSIDAVVGNVPFASIKQVHRGARYSLHDYFIAKSMDALKPGGILALITSRLTLDKRSPACREYLAGRADFLGAIRLPSEAFQRQGTSVVSDILFLRKRSVDESARHTFADWLETGPLDIVGQEVWVNRYFLCHPDMVLGDWGRGHQLYANDGLSVTGNGDLAEQLDAAIHRLPEFTHAGQIWNSASTAPTLFARPPPRIEAGEGSFYIGEDGRICQVLDGRAWPVRHGRTALRSSGSKTGRRLAALIRLRDEARLVLQSQNEGSPEAERNVARRALNGAYDRFVSVYGPINKLTFAQTRDGRLIRRLPNVAVFREDPHAMLVMSLEEYDEAAGTAEKAAIFRQDVVGAKAPITSVTSAEEGLLVSLDRLGKVDLAQIAALYGHSEDQVLMELGDLVYRNPETDEWETADEYLSGNVRAKLAAAERAGPEFARHVEALRAVQPSDVLPGDIDANLGAPWIPVADVQTCLSEILGVPADTIRIAHLVKEAAWSVDADYATLQSVAATTEFGTERANAMWLIELSLNMKAPTIYDSVPGGNRDERVLNQEATLAARDKQTIIKARFRARVFEDPQRAERLVRIYNDTFNSLRPRLFDGSHLEFPGMNPAIELRSHQKAAVWRGMSSGNVLLAHAVGAGKTYVMAATGMKLRQAGLVKKPLYAVPNHMLEQFAREFLQLYPNANLLIATKDDLARSRRKHLTAKIASGSWDGIIMTHSSFERIGMSSEYQERFLRQQIAEFDQLLCDAAAGDETRPQRNMIKMIEKQKAAREARLKELMAEEKKDDGLVFDELGIDHLFIDEAQYFKNLETPTKMQRVAGIQTAGSERAMDLYTKARFLDERHPGHGVTFASGTPISNTMVEMYTVQRFLDQSGLAARGLEHFDAWAANFGEVVESLELSPDGATLLPRSRFARFCNLPELQQMFRAFADVQTDNMLALPRPGLEGGKPTIVACPMSAAQADLQQGLVRRYERLRSQWVDPREDNALLITTDGRKLALDPRLVAADGTDDPASKVNRLVENIEGIFRRSAPARGTQLVFCDLGVRSTSWGFSLYEDVIAKLVARGIPREQIAAIGDADSDARKQSLFERMRSGSVRILIGSTQKMGTGTNVQKRLTALHHLDAPWKPAEVEQREGRILRQGNDNKNVAIFRYVTEGSFDAFLWQALETKARFIAQVMTGESGVRRSEDIGGQELSYAEVKAIASGNPAVLALAQCDAELKRLVTLKKNHADEQFVIRRKLRELPERIAWLRKRIEDLMSDQAIVATHADETIVLSGPQMRAENVVDELGRKLLDLPARVSQTTRSILGRYRGLLFGLLHYPQFRPDVFLEGTVQRTAALSRDLPGARAVLNALSRLAGSYQDDLGSANEDLVIAERQLRDYEARTGCPFPYSPDIAELESIRDELRELLSDRTPAVGRRAGSTVALLAERVRKAAVAQAVVAAQARDDFQSAVAAAEPIASRVRRRLESTLGAAERQAI